MTRRVLIAAFAFILGCLPASAAPFHIESRQVLWEQVDKRPSFGAFMEREEFSNLDRVGRMVFFAQTGTQWPKLEELSVRWQVKQGEQLIAENSAPLTKGLLDVSFSLSELKPGRYDVNGELRQGEKVLARDAVFFRVIEKAALSQTGRIALVFPRGVAGHSTFPVSAGVPFPKGALWSKENVRVVKEDGTLVAASTQVRSRWGHRDEASIRWLGVDFQAEPSLAYWPKREGAKYFLEYGPNVKHSAPPQSVSVNDTAAGLEINTGPLQFVVRSQGFNLLDNVRLNGKPVLTATNKDGLYLVDHEGSTYRAANDRETKLTVEESTPLRAVIRAEGWYVKDGSDGTKYSYRLPTDKLCKFVTRLEAYAGKPYVRVLNTWIITYDSFTVRLRDVGVSLPLQGATAAQFGIEGEAHSRPAVEESGVRLVQHLPHEFVIENGSGKSIKTGKHSAGWVLAETPGAAIAISNRDTWERFPKELEVLPNAIKLHVWPAHGKDHPQIKETDHKEIHKLWFAHQGRELNLKMPWKYFFGTARITGRPSEGVYTAPGIAQAGVHSSAMGAAITSDFLVGFSEPQNSAAAIEDASTFQTAPHVLPDPKWLCDSLAVGYMQPYDPKKMARFETIISSSVRDIWRKQDESNDYGMWIYRAWHHGLYKGDGKWELYRLWNATHHYEAFMPWMLYARSGDPFYLTQGEANARVLSDVQIIHYDDPEYPQIDFHSQQKRIVGSTKHTNGFSTWGGDHGLLGHNTCYNGLMLAYYLTGDLRFKEVVVDEWQKTLVEDRKNPQFVYADKSKGGGSGRDDANALGELIDLYQLTYHPALLAHMKPIMARYLKDMYLWGMPTHNVLLFYGSQQARDQLLVGAEAARAHWANTPEAYNAIPKNDPHNVWTLNLAHHEHWALAAMLAPEKGYHRETYLIAANPPWRKPGEKMDAPLPPDLPMIKVADYIIYVPHAMRAIAEAGGIAHPERLREVQSLPAATKKGVWTHIVVREDKDRAFDVSFTGNIGEGSVPLQVFGPKNERVLSATLPTGNLVKHKVTVPADGVAGQYSIFINLRDGQDGLQTPLTDLPGEVYVVAPAFYLSGALDMRFFTRSRGDTPETLNIKFSGKPTARIESVKDGKVLAQFQNGEPLEFAVGPDGVWFVARMRYGQLQQPMLFSLSPEQWFVPNAAQLELKPQ